MRIILNLFVMLVISLTAQASSIDLLSTKDIATGLKQALSQSSNAAITKLGKVDGFLGNDKVKIPLPENLQKAEQLMRNLGFGKYADEVIVSMNRAAESAVPEAKNLLLNAIKQMTLEDARNILNGGNDAATVYFRKTTESPLREKFLPIVSTITNRVGLVEKYNRFAGRAVKYRLVEEKDSNIEAYVTQKALDGLFLMMTEEEKLIRADPVKQTTKILKKIFGNLK